MTVLERGNVVATIYRIEIDVALDEGMTGVILEATRKSYQGCQDARTEEFGEQVMISPEDFIEDAESALLELVHSAFPDLPGVEVHALKCGRLKCTTP